MHQAASGAVADAAGAPIAGKVFASAMRVGADEYRPRAGVDDMRLEIFRCSDAAQAARWLALRRQSLDADLALLLILSVRDEVAPFISPPGLRWMEQGEVIEQLDPLSARRDASLVQVVADGPQGRLLVAEGTSALLFCLHFTDAALRRFAQAQPRADGETARLLPMTLAAHEPIAHHALQTARRALIAASPNEGSPEFALIARGLFERQAALRARLPEVPGRNPRHRLALYIRLLRVREVLAGTPARWPAVEAMARQARLSPFHFARTYARLFDITPHQELAQSRLRMASRLLADSRLAIVDVALALGYGSRSSFTRWLKLTTGLAPTTLRATIAREWLREQTDARALAAPVLPQRAAA